MAIDEQELHAYLGRFVVDLGATVQAATVLIGDRLGLYRALAELGPSTPAELAARTGTAERYVAEWLRAQVAGGYVSWDGEAERFHLDEIQAFTLVSEDNPFFLPGAFQLAAAAARDEPAVAEAFRTGEGVGWHEHNTDVFVGCERFFRPGYSANLVSSWLPACDGVVEKLTAGGRVADIGCGLGASTRMMAAAFPASRVTGFDYHDESIARASKQTAEEGLQAQVDFEVAAAADYPGTGYDLVTSFDSLHDMGDPVGAARHVLQSLAPEGTWLVVEPAAGDRFEDNLNPVGRAYYSFSTLLCVPNSLSQEVGLALGAQAGEAAIRGVMEAAGFTRFRRVAETPFNLVFEVRP
ncbi:methyltransferase family protein [Motilibacter peucedani]|uniref:Methyltransferase family protein n=1 Tax=Motilibacter peucedani TaxID=598650 RepID=A0A420XME9_9ACTN|nr:class I SAM-dependent methyltransferase [Motilibacter peucedani]RKS71518.1 methyltransferase family protein [Motilibacter peucedani]